MHPSVPTRQRPRALLLAALVAVALAVLPIATVSSQPAPPVDPAASGIVEIPVTFEVQNVNRSAVPCEADGNTYEVRGHVVAPEGALGDPAYPAATLYLHGLAYGQFFYDFDAVPGYDYAAEQAAAGNVSVVIDRLGYDSSDKPTGTDICVGSRADIAHQIVTQLRSGEYTAEGVEAQGFERVVLAGHSLGGQIAQVAAYSFGDIDGLIVISYSDTVQSPLLVATAEDTAALCARGGVPAEGESPPSGYAPFSDGTEMAFQAGNFTDAADPAVVAAATELRNLDPCGDTASFNAATQTNIENVAQITVPTLVVIGQGDALFPPPAGPEQAALLTGSDDVTVEEIPDTGHAITLHLTADDFRTRVATWLAERGFSGPAVGGEEPGDGDRETGRLAGPDRITTAIAIAQRQFPDGADVAYLARADEFPDALAGGTLTDGPVLLVPTCGELPAAVADEIARLDPSSVFALGGPDAVCDELLEAAGDV